MSDQDDKMTDLMRKMLRIAPIGEVVQRMVHDLDKACTKAKASKLAADVIFIDRAEEQAPMDDIPPETLHGTIKTGKEALRTLAACRDDIAGIQSHMANNISQCREELKRRGENHED